MSSQRVQILPTLTITTALTGSVVATKTVKGKAAAREIALQANFDYGSGGTTAKAWFQTSFDGGVTWHDLACFAFATADARKLANVVSNPATPAAVAAATDATLADDTVKNGPMGDQFRVKLTTTGTYAGATTLTIDAIFKE